MPELLSWLVDNESSFRKSGSHLLSRLPSLYSDLSVQKRTNPEGYAANVTAWQSALTRAALAGQLPTDSRLVLQSSNELLDALASSEYGRPSGLGLILDDSVRSGKMFENRDFLIAAESVYQRNWIPSPWSVLQWGLRQVGVTSGRSFDNDGRLRAGELVLISALEELSKQAAALEQSECTSMVDRVMTREAFFTKLVKSTEIQLTPQDQDVLLRYLQRDKQTLSYDSTTVKFRSDSSSLPEAITTEDTTIASMKSLIFSLSSQIASLNARISTLQTNAQAAVKTHNKQAALSALRSKKLAERSLQQRTDTLNQLEEVFSKIEQAVDQVQIFNAMQAGAGVLKSLNSKVGGVERIDKIVDNLREQMDQVDEVSRVLQEPLDGNKVVDEAELDDELEAMEREEATIRETQRQERETAAVKKQIEDLERVEAETRRSQTQQIEKQQAQTKEKEDQVLQASMKQLDRMSIEEPGVTERPEPQVAS